jgi:PAS domain S-box-containing protein
MMTPPLRSPFEGRAWFRTWVWTAFVGAGILLVFFGGYEIVERGWLLERLSRDDLFLLHVVRGVLASVVLASWAFYNTWRARQRYDAAFREAYRALRAAFDERSRALAQERSFTERLFDSLRDRMVVLDRQGRVVKANRVAADAGGEDPCGLGCDMFAGACRFDSADCIARQSLETGLPVLGKSVRTDPRSGRVFSLDAYPIHDADGQVNLVIASARDITEGRRMEAQLAYQEKLAALGMLAAGIAHDIGNPLASMSSELEMLESEEDLGRVRESVAVLREHVLRVQRTLREMSDFARRRGDAATTVSVDTAVKDALRMVRHDPRARRIRLETQISPDLPTLWMIEDHLVMVLVNLLINAFDALPDGGTIAVRAFRRAGAVHLEVCDDGTGMSEEVRRRATEPLFTTKGGGHGTGLGLSVCTDVVRSAGGTLHIDSALGRGTTVEIDLPIRPTEAAVAHG